MQERIHIWVSMVAFLHFAGSVPIFAKPEIFWSNRWMNEITRLIIAINLTNPWLRREDFHLDSEFSDIEAVWKYDDLIIHLIISSNEKWMLCDRFLYLFGQLFIFIYVGNEFHWFSRERECFVWWNKMVHFCQGYIILSFKMVKSREKGDRSVAINPKCVSSHFCVATRQKKIWAQNVFIITKRHCHTRPP